MRKEFKYRRASLTDQQSLRLVGMAAYGTYQKVLAEEGWERLKRNIEDVSIYTDLLAISTCIVCEHDDQIVAMAFYIPHGNPTSVYPADWCYIRMVGVHPDYSGHGIGKELMRRCVERARDTNEKIIGLHTSEFMDAARHIYESMGFVRAKELEPRFGKRYWLYRMEV